MDGRIYERLIEIAKSGTITYYSEIAPLAGLDMATDVGRIKIAQLLDEINFEERDHERPMLSSVVILKDYNSPGTGYYECARQLGKYGGSNNEKDKLLFWISELNNVHKYWKSH